jgi:hypothetical protein
VPSLTKVISDLRGASELDPISVEDNNCLLRHSKNISRFAPGPQPLALRLVPRNPRGEPWDCFSAAAGSGLLGGTRGRSSGEVGGEASRAGEGESALTPSPRDRVAADCLPNRWKLVILP